MSLRLLADENLDSNLIRALIRRFSELDLVRAHDVGLAGADDPTILRFAGNSGRVLVTHDRNTVPRYALERVRAGEPMAGVVVVPATMPIGQAADEIILLAECYLPVQAADHVLYLPLK